MTRFQMIETSNYQSSARLQTIVTACQAVALGRCEAWEVESALEDLEMALRHREHASRIARLEQAVLTAWNQQ